MTKEMLASIARHAITTVSGVLVASGELDPGAAETLGGAAGILVVLVWSFVAKRRARA